MKNALYEVYSGFDNEVNDIVVSVYDKSLSSYNPDKIKWILQEAKMMMKFYYPTLPIVLDIVEDDNYVFIVRLPIEGS